MVPIATFFDERHAPGTRALVALARERARHAPWLPALDCEALLERPLAEVRETLRVGSPARYRRHFQRPEGLGLVPEPPAAPRHVLLEG